MRLIDADALKNDGQLYIHGADGKDYYEIDHAPTADADEVVHGWIKLINRPLSAWNRRGQRTSASLACCLQRSIFN